MNKRSSASARVLAATALVVGLIVVLIAIAGALGGGDGSGGSHQRKHADRREEAKPKQVPTTYEVKSGDTLISIAHSTGVPVARIEELNPEVDPQILVAGERLKLR